MNGRDKQRINRRKRGCIFMAACLLLLLFAGCADMTEEEYMFGKHFTAEEVTEFYYTVTETSYPPNYERRHFFKKDGGYFYFHEKLEGSLPAYSESVAAIDLTDERVQMVTDEQWNQLMGILLDGKVTKRTDNVTSGGSKPAVYLYWTRDKGKYQVYSFPSTQAEAAFLAFCEGLAE